MKTFSLISLVSMLLFISNSVNAASILQWEAIPTDVHSNEELAVGLVSGSGIENQTLMSVSSNVNDFTSTWNFNVKTSATERVVNFFNTKFDNSTLIVDDLILAGSDLGITTQWAFSTLLSVGSRYSLAIATGSGSKHIPNNFSAQKYNIQLAATPIPANVWLISSCLIGIIGLLLRRKSSIS